MKKIKKIKKVEFIDKVGSSELEKPVLQTKLSENDEVKRIKSLKKQSDKSLKEANRQIQTYKRRTNHLAETIDELKKELKYKNQENTRLSSRISKANAYLRKSMIIFFTKKQF